MSGVKNSTLVYLAVCLLVLCEFSLSYDPVYKISTIMGGGNNKTGDGGLATSVTLVDPIGLDVNSKGEVFIVENACKVRKVDVNGIISTVAGTKYTRTSSGSGGPATLAALHNPTGVSVNKGGEIYIVEFFGHVVRKVFTNGTIVDIIGRAELSGFSGDGDLATSAQLSYPYSVAVSSSGEVYVADYGNNRIRKVEANGTISTFAGNGNGGYSGDGGLATDTSLDSPMLISLSSSGELYSPIMNMQIIVKISKNGIITTVAGTGKQGYGGDGGLATRANLTNPNDVATGPFGEFYIADSGNNVIRKVSANGIITTIAGNNVAGYGGDGGLATNAKMSSPVGIAVDSNGVVYFTDYNNNRVRKLVPYCTDGGVLINGICYNHTCFGKMFSNESVCSGHGECTGMDTCLCQSGWKGDSQCSKASCELVNNCNGHGYCISNNTCLCQSGWKGEIACSQFSCEMLNNCNGHGSCISNNTCSCNSQWKHLDCSISECLMSFNSSDNQLYCSSTTTTSSKTVTFTQLQSNTLSNLWIDLNNGNQQVNSPVGTSILNVSLSNYFISSSVTPSNSQFYSNITNLIIQYSNSSLIFLQLSNPVNYIFNNLNLDPKSFNYTCLRFDFNVKKWTNESISTILSANKIICSTNHVTTSVAVQRSVNPIVIVPTSSVIPKPSSSSSISPTYSIKTKNSISPLVSTRTTINNTDIIGPSMILIVISVLLSMF